MATIARAQPRREPVRLPLPSLERTCERYLQAVSIHLSEREQQSTATCVREFLSASGPALQRQLQGWDAAQATSFIHDFWLDSWLEGRAPLPLAQNPGSKSFDPEGLEGQSFARRVAILISRALSFYDQVSRGTLAPDRSGIFPWTMDQYPFLFSTSRIPGIKKDRICSRQDAQHVIVLRKGHFFALPVVEREEWISLDALTKGITAILEWQPLDQPEIGLLTSLPRASWAIWRERLAVSHPENARALELIDSAIVAFCIDPAVGSDDAAAARRALTGRPENRWYDRSVQIIYSEDGVLMGNLEHSAVDGWPVSRYSDEICRAGEGMVGRATDLPKPELLGWHAPEDVLTAIDDARHRQAESASHVKTAILEMPGRSQADLRSFGIGADFLAQFSFQFAYRRTFGRLPLSYETVGMRHFRHGRTENLRPVTAASAQALMLFDRHAEPEERIQSLRTANAEHQRRMNACARGWGIDRHLYALWVLATHLDAPMPSIFTDTAFGRLLYEHDLSTGALPDSTVKFDVFGPAVPDGFAIGYVAPARGGLRLSVTSTSADHAQFCEALTSSFLQLQALVERAGTRP